MKKRHNPSIPRQMYWSDELDESNVCPQCQSPLESEKHTYIVGIHRNEAIQSYLIENDGGYFCPKCPTIVLNTNTFAQITVDGDTDDSVQDINVAGLVDTLNMPEGQDFTLREANHSTPLIEFLPRPEKSNP